MIRSLAEEGRTMLLVTHELGFAYHVATRVIFLADGTIHEQGTPDEVLKHPKEERTRAFLARHKRIQLLEEDDNEDGTGAERAGLQGRSAQRQCAGLCERRLRAARRGAGLGLRSGFVLGDGVWEGLRLVKGRLISLDAHLDRLFEGARSIDLDIGLTRDGVVKAVQDTLDRNGMTDGAHIRLMVTRGLKKTPNQDPRFVIGKATIVIVAEYKTPLPEAKAKGYALFTSTFRTTGPEVRPAAQLAQPAEPDPGADPGDQGRRRRGADARSARLRRLLQLDQLLHRARPRAVDLDRPLQLQGHHPAERDRRLARGGRRRDANATSRSRRSIPPTRPSSPAPWAASRRSPGSTVGSIGDGKAGPVTKEASDLYLKSVGAL